MSAPVLFLPYEVLSSVTRQLALAARFRERGRPVTFATGGPYVDLIERAGFTCEPLENLSADRLLAILRELRENATGFAAIAMRLYRELDLERYVRAELACIRRTRPAVVISEERPTAQISAHVAGVAHVSLRNTYRTEHSALPLIESTGALRWLEPDPMRLQSALLRLAGAPFFARMRAIWRRHGMRPPLTYDGYLEGDDLVLLCDLPELSPSGPLPSRYVVIGPLFWEGGDVALPPWWNELPTSRELVYVSLGSTATPELFRALLGALESTALEIVVSTGRQIELDALPRSPRIRAAELVPGERVLERARACVCHGGNGTVYQALSRGVPLICVPTHLEQRFNARRVEQLGLGLHLDLEGVRRAPEQVAAAVRRVVDDTAYGERAADLERRIGEVDAPGEAVEAVERLIANGAARADAARNGAARAGAARNGAARADAPGGHDLADAPS